MIPFTRVLLAGALLSLATPAFAQASRVTVLEMLRRAVVRAPLNANMTTTRTTPQGPVTISTQNTFNGTSGTFDTTVALPGGKNLEAAGTITVSPENSVAVNGVLTGPAGQSTRYSTVATPSASGISVSSSITPSGGNPITRTAVFTPPAAPMDDPEDFVADLLKRLKAAFKPKG